MTEEEFEKTIEATANVMTAFHQRLERVEQWMLIQEEAKKEKPRLITNMK